MGHKCYISFKTEDIKYKEEIQEEFNIDMIDKSLNESIDSNDEDYIIRKIREDYIADSTVTIFLIGNKSAEKLGIEEQKYIKRELQASLYNGSKNKKNGILGVVLPTMYNIYCGETTCGFCGNNHHIIEVNDNTTIKEFSYNYYIPHNKCAWADDDRYCILVKWCDFKDNPEKYIDLAFDKRNSEISKKTKVSP